MTDPNCPWNVLPMKPKGDDNETVIHTAVGAALSRWEELEFILSKLYEALLNAETDGASAGYGLLVAFSSRYALLEQAEKSFPFRSQPPFDGIANFIKVVNNFVSRRNDIAHGVVADFNNRGRYLGPAWYATSKLPRDKRLFTEEFNFGAGRYAYTADQIDAYRTRFHHLNRQATDFLSAVRQAWREHEAREAEGLRARAIEQDRATRRKTRSRKSPTKRARSPRK